MKRGQKTAYPGITKLNPRTYHVRVRKTHPRTHRRLEKTQTLTGVNIRDALRIQQDLREELENELRGYNPADARLTVGEFAQSWIESKATHLDPGTLERYAVALERHILPALGDRQYNTVTRFDIQQWVDHGLRKTYETPSGKTKSYSVSSVKGWFRILRTMTQDAMDPLGFERDPTARIRFADEPESAKSCAVSAEQLQRFLALVLEHYPQHYALIVVLAFTGMRWCHASALRWDDWDESTDVLTIQRKGVRGRTGPVTRKKRAPKQLPLIPCIADALRWHRQWMVENQVPGYDSGWMFPSRKGILRLASSCIAKAWARCRKLASISEDFNPHGLRYTFTDLIRLIDADPIARREITGHVTEVMQRKYSTVGLQEKRSILERASALVPLPRPYYARKGVDGGVNGDQATCN